MNCIDLMSKTSNNANLQKLSKYNEVHGFDVKTNKNVELGRKPFKTTQIYKNDQITMKCMDLTSKQIASIWCQNDKKSWVTSQTIWKTAKLQKWSNYDELHRFDVKTIKMLSYFPNHSKQLKPTKVFKLQWSASIWCQKHQTTQNYQSDQITMKCVDLTSKQIASIWCQNDKKFWVTSQTIQNNSNLQKYSNYNELHRFDVKNIKQRKTTKVIKLRRSAWIWRQNEQKCWVTSETIQNNANLQKLSK